MSEFHGREEYGGGEYENEPLWARMGNAVDGVRKVAERVEAVLDRVSPAQIIASLTAIPRELADPVDQPTRDMLVAAQCLLLKASEIITVSSFIADEPDPEPSGTYQPVDALEPDKIPQVT